MLARAILPLLALAACAEPPTTRGGATTAPTAVEEIAAPSPKSTTPRDIACDAAAGEAILASPKAPNAGVSLRILAAVETAEGAALTLFGPDGQEVATTSNGHGGPPAWWSLEVVAPQAGRYRAVLARKDAVVACREITVDATSTTPAKWAPLWPIERRWDRAAEDLYSAWIDKLFDAPLDEQPSWPALHDVLRDPARNILHDHLGFGEDDAGPRALVIDPDCADLPYFLRAYFAYKVGLPFTYSSCTRGGAGSAPKCMRVHSQAEASKHRRSGPAVAFGNFLRVDLADAVHSGNGRVAATDDAGDYYPVRLDEKSLRPGAVYADPYGHMLVIARRIAQTDASGGVLLAVDGQPDGTIARRRFWRGNFLFALDPATGSPGFKRFRPVAMNGGRQHSLTNAEITESPDYGDYSLDQYNLGVDGFYDRMDDVLSPHPLDPAKALRETIQALDEQVRGRLLSVENGEKHKATDSTPIDMPEGAEIFETTGPWEDFSTPSRDLRLLIAIDIVRGFSEHVARRPERFAMPAGKSVADVRADLDGILRTELQTRTVTYTRSDGSAWKLTLGDVLARSVNLEMAYDPNDCVEVRWGAHSGGDEIATCHHRAPSDQRGAMAKARPWFHERKRPARE